MFWTEILIQMGLPDSRFAKTSFSTSWILDLDPKVLPWIQYFLSKSWILIGKRKPRPKKQNQKDQHKKKYKDLGPHGRSSTTTKKTKQKKTKI